MNKAFTIIELLLVIAIIGILAVVIIVVLGKPRQHLYLSASKSNMRALDTALNSYLTFRGKYPDDVNRGVPPDLTSELENISWTKAPWPDSIYDWDNWIDPSTGERIMQFSIRFCQTGDLSSCKYPDFDWARNFDYHSSVYYCVSGPCRSHISRPIDHPGYCVNCEE